MSDTLPVAVAVVELLLRQAEVYGRPFSEELAVTHLRLDKHKGALAPQAHYARYWNWSTSKVNRCWSDLMAQVDVHPETKKTVETPAEPQPELFEPPKPAPAKKKKAKGKKRTKQFGDDTWEYRYALAMVDRMKAEGIKMRAYDRNPESSLQDYAYMFDLLHRVDKHPRERIADVVKYLFDEDDFWVQTGNFQSPLKLRRRRDDVFLFDKLYQQMVARRNGKPGKKSTTALQRSTAETLAILRARRGEGQ